jgi:hypothetical protein
LGRRLLPKRVIQIQRLHTETTLQRLPSRWIEREGAAGASASKKEFFEILISEGVVKKKLRK